uniref:Uncharacterized protein n=1 Tax=Strigamia maritima TaxID=126957 RepID=T1IMC5_STRMM
MFVHSISEWNEALHYQKNDQNQRQKPQKRKRSIKEETDNQRPISTTAAEKQNAAMEYPGEATRRLGLEVFSPALLYTNFNILFANSTWVDQPICQSMKKGKLIYLKTKKSQLE